jgi:hypothetical protein
MSRPLEGDGDDGEEGMMVGPRKETASVTLAWTVEDLVEL